MTVHSAKTTGELAQEYDEFTINAILDVIRSRNGLGASPHEIQLMVMPLVRQKFQGMHYSEQSLELDLDRLLMEEKISVAFGRYKIAL